MEKIAYMEETLLHLHEVLGEKEKVNTILMNSEQKLTTAEPKVRYFLLKVISESRT